MSLLVMSGMLGLEGKGYREKAAERGGEPGLLS